MGKRTDPADYFEDFFDYELSEEVEQRFEVYTESTGYIICEKEADPDEDGVLITGIDEPEDIPQNFYEKFGHESVEDFLNKEARQLNPDQGVPERHSIDNQDQSSQRYRELNIGGEETIIYDDENDDAWVQSDNSLDLDNMI